MISAKQKIIRKMNIFLFVVILVMLTIGNFYVQSSTSMLFVYYYATIAFITIIAFLLTMYDIFLLKKSIKEKA